MKFVCLGYIDEKKFQSLSEEEGSRIMKECFDYDDELREGGHFLGGEALGPSSSGIVLRSTGNGIGLSDGPFSETKEALGGILLLEARDLNHAISLMTKHPGVKLGPFEIRPADDHIEGFIKERDKAFARRKRGSS